MFRADTPVEQHAHTVSSEILAPVGRNLHVKPEISTIAYETWIQPCRLIEIKDNMMALLVEYDFVRELLEKRYLVMLKAAAKVITKQDITEIKLITEEEYRDMEEGKWKK